MDAVLNVTFCRSAANLQTQASSFRARPLLPPIATMATDPSTNTKYDPQKVVLYRRNRFQSRLPKDRLYTQSHFWLEEAEPGLRRVGFTRFATRMLGEIVEQGFEVRPGASVTVGQRIGWV